MYFHNFIYRYKNFDDQTIFWLTLRNNIFLNIVPLSSCNNFDGITTGNKTTEIMLKSNDKPIVSCSLDSCMFSSGSLTGEWFPIFSSSCKQFNVKPIIIHANYMLGNQAKMNAFKRHNLWLASSQQGDCKPFTSNF